jgi:hypothetical protein
MVKERGCRWCQAFEELQPGPSKKNRTPQGAPGVASLGAIEKKNIFSPFATLSAIQNHAQK